MTDLLRLPDLAFVDQREEDGELVITVRSKQTRLPPQCCLLHGLKHGHFGVAKTTSRPPASRGRPGHVVEFATKLWLPEVTVDPVWVGVPISTLEADLEAGTF